MTVRIMLLRVSLSYANYRECLCRVVSN